jgi:hypothetical protein
VRIAGDVKMHPFSPLCFLPDRTEHGAVLTSSEARPLLTLSFYQSAASPVSFAFPFLSHQIPNYTWTPKKDSRTVLISCANLFSYFPLYFSVLFFYCFSSSIS